MIRRRSELAFWHDPVMRVLRASIFVSSNIGQLRLRQGYTCMADVSIGLARRKSSRAVTRQSKCSLSD
jgi:hypothetical protein